MRAGRRQCARFTKIALEPRSETGCVFPRFMQSLNGLIPAAAAGKFIRAVNTVTLSASTGAAGNFGVTATRLRGTLFMPIANAKFSADWANLPINTIPNSACPFIAVLASTSAAGLLRGGGKIAHG